MSYWELETEFWELEDNWDGAKWMESRGRVEHLNDLLTLQCETSEAD